MSECSFLSGVFHSSFFQPLLFFSLIFNFFESEIIFISFYYLYLMSSMDQSANKKPTDPMLKNTGYFCEKTPVLQQCWLPRSRRELKLSGPWQPCVEQRMNGQVEHVRHLPTHYSDWFVVAVLCIFADLLFSCLFTSGKTQISRRKHHREDPVIMFPL